MRTRSEMKEYSHVMIAVQLMAGGGRGGGRKHIVDGVAPLGDHNRAEKGLEMMFPLRST